MLSTSIFIPSYINKRGAHCRNTTANRSEYGMHSLTLFNRSTNATTNRKRYKPQCGRQSPDQIMESKNSGYVTYPSHMFHPRTGAQKGKGFQIVPGQYKNGWNEFFCAVPDISELSREHSETGFIFRFA